jgi:hypothetical protein
MKTIHELVIDILSFKQTIVMTLGSKILQNDLSEILQCITRMPQICKIVRFPYDRGGHLMLLGGLLHFLRACHFFFVSDMHSKVKWSLRTVRTLNTGVLPKYSACPRLQNFGSTPVHMPYPSHKALQENF